MNRRFKYLLGYSLAIIIGFVTVQACTLDPGETFQDNFDRSGMLAFWADEIIVPEIEDFNDQSQELLDAMEVFVADPSSSNLNFLRTAWLSSYTQWQHVELFDIGKAEEIGWRNYTNIYPTDTDKIEENIQSEDYNLVLPSNYVAQGFPALDYLLFGLNEDDEALIQTLSDPKYSAYLVDIVQRIYNLSSEVLNDWKSSYRSVFVESDGSSATSSVDKMVNDFLFHFEKFFRAGKVGIPAGVFSGSPISSSVEAPYSGIYSKSFLLESFEVIRLFFEGEGRDGQIGSSLKQYLEFIGEQRDASQVSSLILTQWTRASEEIETLEDNFKLQVEMDNSKMLKVYDEIQKSVVLLKVDMLQALNIQVDYVDADGD